METRIGIDIGGTFTDLVYLTPEGGIHRAKVLSTPDDYARGIAEGLGESIARFADREMCPISKNETKQGLVDKA